MKLISLKAVVELILSNKAKHCSERIDADDVCDFERKKRIESRMDEDDVIGNKVSDLPSAFDGMTNGEVIKMLFPYIEVSNYGVVVRVKGLDCDKGALDPYRYFWTDWWNAPYKEGANE